jgi:hypothetical protein
VEAQLLPNDPVYVPPLISSGQVWTATEFVERSHRKQATCRVVDFQKAQGNSAGFTLLLHDIGPAVWMEEAREWGAPGLQLPDARLAKLWGDAKFLLFPLSTRVFHSSLTNNMVMSSIICSPGPQLGSEQLFIDLFRWSSELMVEVPNSQRQGIFSGRCGGSGLKTKCDRAKKEHIQYGKGRRESRQCYQYASHMLRNLHVVVVRGRCGWRRQRGSQLGKESSQGIHARLPLRLLLSRFVFAFLSRFKSIPPSKWRPLSLMLLRRCPG